MTRLQIELDEQKLEVLEGLMETCGLRTKKDLINNALALLEWAIREREKGNIITSLNEGESKYKEVLLPIFSHVRSHVPKPPSSEVKEMVSGFPEKAVR